MREQGGDDEKPSHMEKGGIFLIEKLG